MEPVTEINNNNTECAICFNEYNITTTINCECGFHACIECVKTYMKHTITEPCCPDCKHIWDIDFQYEKMGKKFINNEYRKNKEQILFDIERSRFPETMNTIEKKILNNKIKQDLEEQVIELRKQYENIKFDMKNDPEIILLYKKLKKYQKLIKISKDKYRIMASNTRRLIHDINIQINRINNGENISEDTDIESINSRTIPCPSVECRGIMDKKYLCSICDTKVCSKCHNIITEYEDHVCKDSDIQSVKMIMNDTKPCPKCGVRIHKIIGCDQMWCTQCKVVFSWDTGKEVKTQHIHNPHFIEWNANNGNTHDIRNAGDLHCGGINIMFSTMVYSRLAPGCNPFTRWELYPEKNISNIDIFKHIIFTEDYLRTGDVISKDMDRLDIILTDKYISKSYIDKDYHGKIVIYCKQNIGIMEIISTIYQNILQTIDYQVYRYRNLVNMPIDNEDLRIKYIQNEITEKQFKSELIKKDKARNKNIKICRLFDLYNVVCTERFNEITNRFGKYNGVDTINNDEFIDICKMLQEMDEMRKYINVHMCKIASNFNCKSYYISPLMYVRNKMFTVKEIEQLIIKDRTYNIDYERLFIRK